MAWQDLVNGGLGIIFFIKEAVDGSRRHREMAVTVRELAEKVPTNPGPSTSVLEPPKATSSPPEGEEEIVVRKGLDPKTLEFQENEIWDHLWLLEGHLKRECKNCASDLGCCWKHGAGLVALARESQSMSTDPRWGEVIEFGTEIFNKCQEGDILKGTYAADYPGLAVRASELRKKFKKTLPLPPQEGITLEEAKAEAAELAAKEIERQWETE